MSAESKSEGSLSSNTNAKTLWQWIVYHSTEGTGSLIVAFVLAMTIRWALVEAYVIPSGSMLPSLLLHDHIFVNKLVYGLRVPFTENWLAQFRIPARGEVIVFKYPLNKDTFYIKRVVGLPGDKIYYENGRLYINDKAIETQAPGLEDDWRMLADSDFQKEDVQNPIFMSDSKDQYESLSEALDPKEPHSILLRKDGGYSRTEGPFIVPPGHLFAMGDNRDNSSDSRRWGFLPIENVLGRAMFVWLSCEKTLPVVSFLCDPTEIRWRRFFHGVH